MKVHIANCLLFVASIAVAACSTVPVITKSAQSDELQKETTVGVALPADCPMLAHALPAGRSTFNVHYQEPATDQYGKVIANLAYTTIYLKPPNGQTKAIRILSPNPHGGALVTVRDIPIPSSEIELCITATNLYGKESLTGYPAR